MLYFERPHEPAISYELDDYTDPWKKRPVSAQFDAIPAANDHADIVTLLIHRPRM